MIVDDENSKPKADSPALTEAMSYTSSPEPSPGYDSNHSSVRRTLFKIKKDGQSSKGAIGSPEAFETPSAGFVGHGAVLTPNNRENGPVDTTSITSSDTTAIPSWNLSAKDATEKNVEVPLNHFILSKSLPFLSSPPTFNLDQTQPLFSSPSSFASEATHLSDGSESPLVVTKTTSYSLRQPEENKFDRLQIEAPNKPSVVMEDPPEEPTSCNAGLNITPVQLAEMFLAFGQSARQRCQGSDQVGEDRTETNPITPSPKKVVKSTEDNLATTPPLIVASRDFSASNSQSNYSRSSFVRSIARERDALKISTERDARMILSLQQAVNTQKELNSLKEIEIEDKQADLLISEEKISTLQKEQDDFLDRETEFIETIQILKEELDKMTLLKSAPSDELDHLKLELEPSSNTESGEEKLDIDAQLLFCQVEKKDARISELEKSLNEKEEEKFDLKTKIDCLNNQHNEATKNTLHPETSGLEDSNISGNDKIVEVHSNAAVEDLLKDIMKRLDAVEIEKKETGSNLTTTSIENDETVRSIPKYEMIESEHNGVKIDVSEDPDAIETTKLIGKTDKDLEFGELSRWCCEWSLIQGE